MMQKCMRWISNGLIFGGIAILIVTGGLYGFSQYEQAQAARHVDAMFAHLPTATPIALSPTPAAPPRAEAIAQGNISDERPSFVPASQRGSTLVAPTALPPTATPVPILPALRIAAPSIHLDAPVLESPVVNGEWQVPKFAAGHLQGTDDPLQGGNVVLAGHVESISSGDVFGQIDQLHGGDIIQLYTKASVVSYRVSKVETVSNDDMQVVGPTPKERLTLITCAGAWLPLQHDYNERTVVIADRVS